MREYFRIAVTVGFLLYWLIAIVRKYMQMKACGRDYPTWISSVCSHADFEMKMKLRRSLLLRELIRQLADLFILCGILFSDLFNVLCGVFPEELPRTVLVSGRMVMISLLVSLPVDWILAHIHNRRIQWSDGRLVFFLESAVGVVIIGFGIDLAYLCVLISKQLDLGNLGVLLCVSVLSAYRLLLIRVQRWREQLAEVPDGELKGRLTSLCEHYGMTAPQIRTGRAWMERFSVEMRGFRHKQLVMDCGIYQWLTDDEICAYVMHTLECERRGMRRINRFWRFCQFTVAVSSLFLAAGLTDGSFRNHAFFLQDEATGKICLAGIIILGWMLLIFLQAIRNTGIKKRLFQADAAVRDAGYGPPHQQALIRVCDIEAVVPGKHMELFCERPVFLQERMRRLGR